MYPEKLDQRTLNSESDFFTLFKLSSNCYAAIEKKGARTGSNAGFVDLGDKVIVFDTFMNINAAKDLLECIKKVTNKDPCFVVNSHYHLDHYGGNEILNSPIIATRFIREKIVTEAPQTVKRILDIEEKDIKAKEEALKIETDKNKILDIENELLFLKVIRENPITVTPPSILMEDTLTFHEPEIEAKLKLVSNAHTQEDLLLIVPDEKIVFMGDLVFSREDPWLGNGDPFNLMNVLDKILEQDFEYFVPGHGPLATREELKLQNQYTNEIINLVKLKMEKGEDIKEVKKSELSEVFHDWESPCFSWNIEFLSNYLKK